jgi:hypothetical protein
MVPPTWDFISTSKRQYTPIDRLAIQFLQMVGYVSYKLYTPAAEAFYLWHVTSLICGWELLTHPAVTQSPSKPQ